MENDADWTVRDEAGYPAPENREGRRAQPFWSSRPRVERIIETVPAYSGFEPEEIPLADFMDEWLPDLERDGVLIGVNWSGPTATGYDVERETWRRPYAPSQAAHVDTRPRRSMTSFDEQLREAQALRDGREVNLAESVAR